MPKLMVNIMIQRADGALDLPIPDYATPGSAGVDLFAAVDAEVTLHPGERKLISTGIRIAIPDGYEAQVRPRSGLALRHGIGMVNAPGTIDADYRGIIGVILINHGDTDFQISRGDRIAQMVIAPVARAEFIETNELPETLRGEGGFGHTGVTSARSN